MGIFNRAWQLGVAGGLLIGGASGQDPKPPVAQPPAATTPAQPDPKKQQFPKDIDGKDLGWFLKESQIRNQRDPQMRQAAIRTIPVFGPDSRKPALPVLVEVINHPEEDPAVRIDAVTVICAMGPDVREEVKLKGVIRTLVTMIQRTGPSSPLRLNCVRALSIFGPDAVTAVPELRTIAGDPSWEVRLAIAESLGSVGSPAKPDADPSMLAAKTLFYILKGGPKPSEPSVAVRMEAVKSLLTIGPPKAKTPLEYQKEIKEYLEPLAERLKYEEKSGDKNVYIWMLLLQIMYDDRMMVDNLKKMTQFVEAPDGPTAAMQRLSALQAIGFLGPKFGEIRLLKPPLYPNPGGPVVDAAIDTIIQSLSYPEPALQIAAMTCLAHIGKEGLKAEKELKVLQAKPLKVPLDAPKDFKPDDTIQKMAGETIEYVTGRKKFGQAAAELKAK